MSETISRPIPRNISVAGWKEVPFVPSFVSQKSREQLVPLGPFSPNWQIFTHSPYYGEGTDSPYQDPHLEGSLITQFVREGVAKRLQVAQAALPNDHYLVVLDAYRTLDVQQSLFNQYHNALAALHPEWSQDELLTETQKYVSIPSTNSKRPSTHNTGGSVDVAIVVPRVEQMDGSMRDYRLELQEIDEMLGLLDENTNWQTIYALQMKRQDILLHHSDMLEFGTQFDHGGDKAALAYYENVQEERELTPEEVVWRDNRRVLYHVMTEAGFVGYPDEWWHYNAPETQMGTKASRRRRASYGAITLSEANMAHESMREGHYAGVRRAASGIYGKTPHPSILPYYSVVTQSVRVTGDIHQTTFPNTEKIQPVA